MSRKDRELQEEVRAHLEMAIRDRIERGEDPRDAAAAAHREFGNVALVQEVTREAWGWMWLERLAQDLRYAARLLRRTPAFTFVAVLSLALGIGASAAIFQVIDALRLRALPVAKPHELVEIAPVTMEGARGNFANWRGGVTNPIWEQLRGPQETLSGTLAWGSTSFNLATGGQAQPAQGLWVSGGFFNVLGILPERGRLLSPADDRRGCAARTVISHSFWQRQFGGDPSVVGRTVTLDSTPVEIVGVTPSRFFGLEVGRTFDVALPICAEAVLASSASSPSRLDSGTNWWLTVVGRLKPGVTGDQASAHMRSLSAGIFKATLPTDYPPVSVPKYLTMTLEAARMRTGVSYLREQYGTPLWLLLALATSVLVIGCANLANLMLARATAREREIAIRLGLGASRTRVMRQLLTESVVLAISGAAGGLAVSQLLSRALVSLVDADTSSVFLAVGLDWHVLGFTAALAALTCLLFGLVPAIRATRTSTAAVMNTTGRGLTTSRQGSGLRRVLVIAQVAMSLLLLAGALLFTRTLLNLSNLDAGFTRDGIMMTQVDFRAARVPLERRAAQKAAILERLRALPGVESAAGTSITPVSGSSWGNDVTVQTPDGPKTVNSRFNRATDGYFATFRTPIVAGRDFDARDAPTAPKVAIVNQVFAKELFGGGSAIGQRFSVEATPSTPATEYEIVGVSANAKYWSLREDTPPVAYFPMAQELRPGQNALIAVRSSLDPVALTAGIVDSFRELDPSVSLSFSRLDTLLQRSLLPERLMASLSLFFGSIAVVIAVIGLYGVIAYTVTRRTNEIGVRMALGASRGDVIALVLREAAILVGIGIATGVAIALPAGKFAESLLFGLEPRDPLTLATAIAILGAVALLASYVPARAASRIEPTAALRVE